MIRERQDALDRVRNLITTPLLGGLPVKRILFLVNWKDHREDKRYSARHKPEYRPSEAPNRNHHFEMGSNREWVAISAEGDSGAF